MHVREAAATDTPAIRRVAERAWRADYPAALDGDTIEAGVNHWYGDPVVKTELQTPHTEFLVAERDGEVEGFVHAHVGAEPTILRLHVRPAARDGSITEALFEAVLDAVEDPDRLRGTVLEANDTMLSFYLERGFERVGTERTTIDGTTYPEAVLERA
ncbi:MAG: N-acetyltransferase family protein [Halodesulfurarchaeum sp.]